jgi:hypothetical protein
MNQLPIGNELARPKMNQLPIDNELTRPDMNQLPIDNKLTRPDMNQLPINNELTSSNIKLSPINNDLITSDNTPSQIIFKRLIDKPFTIQNNLSEQFSKNSQLINSHNTLNQLFDDNQLAILNNESGTISVNNQVTIPILTSLNPNSQTTYRQYYQNKENETQLPIYVN